MAPVFAVSALISSLDGRPEAAVADLRAGERLVAQLEEMTGWFEVETRVSLARAAAHIGDPSSARELTVECDRYLEQIADAPVLLDWLREARRAVESASEVTADLTPAELRVLRFLPTHLSFPEIAAEVYVSPNTVKTQAQAVYRKLGVSSRREAVERGRAAGLMGEDHEPVPQH
jgi:LuxR family maltose regulon positive regulatory protein